MTIIGYDEWADFADILSGRGMIDVELIPEDRRAEIVASYPYGDFNVDADEADSEWESTGGPWFDALEDELADEGYRYSEQ